MTGVLIKEKTLQRDPEGETPQEDGSRGWSDVSTGQGPPKDVSNHPKEEGSMGQILSQGPRSSLQTPQFQTFGLMNSEKINFCDFKPPKLG